MSLVSLENWINGRGAHVKACGLQNNFRATDAFGPGIFRSTCLRSGALCSELSGSGSFGPLSVVRRKTSLCKQKGSKYV